MGWTIDYDEIGAARSILDPLRCSPSGECGEVKPDSPRAELRASQVDPSGETALRIDVDHGEASALPHPRDGELRGKRRLVGATLTLRDRDHQPRAIGFALAEVDVRGHLFGAAIRQVRVLMRLADHEGKACGRRFKLL